MLRTGLGYLGTLLVLTGLPARTLAHRQDHSSTAGSQLKESKPDKPAMPTPKAKICFRPHIETVYQSNFYHVPRSRLDEFDADTKPGERVYKMEGPGEVVTTIVSMGMPAIWICLYGSRVS